LTLGLVLSATCIEVVVAIVGFNLFFQIAVTPLDPEYVDDRYTRTHTHTHARTHTHTHTHAHTHTHTYRPGWLQTASPIFEILVGFVGGGLAGYFLSLTMPGCGPGRWYPWNVLLMCC
jgi:ABC-type nickel/cobalt efflux system permease component RcnA